MAKPFDAVILGAGAAGLFCAIEAGQRGRRVAILEKADRIGKKILISGGGRCNFTNLHCTADNFLSSNPHFAKSALARFTPADFIALVKKHRIRFHEKTLGQLFCDGSAEEIVNMLEAECRVAGAEIFLNTQVQNIQKSNGFTFTSAGDEYHAAALVVATGGLSIPKMGATPFGYEIAKQFGVSLIPPRPALVPLTFGKEDLQRYADLAGVSCEVVARIGKRSFREKMLFTHRGLSGPAILQISSYWKPGDAIEIDLAPGRKLADAILQAKTRNEAAARKALHGVLPNRLADRWLEFHPPAGWTNNSLAAWEKQIHHWGVQPSGTEGYEKAEVTAGGVDTRELSSKTMECKSVPGLYFIGEVVDVTGHLGGYNFQWAWASASAAGQAL